MPTVESGSPSARVLLRCFLRTYFVAAAFNRRGLQNIGMVYALEPGLEVIYPDPKLRRQARKRYLRHYNSHPFWAPLLVGVFLSLEDKIAKGLFPTTVLESVKNTTIYTLSAIGDSVFAGSLLVFWSLSTVTLLLAGLEPWALLWAIAWFTSLQISKVASFTLGYREGLRVLSRLKRWDLINWGARLKMVNAVLLAVILYLVWPGGRHDVAWLAAVGLLGVSAWMVSRAKLSREIIALILLTLYASLPLLDGGWLRLFG